MGMGCEWVCMCSVMEMWRFWGYGVFNVKSRTCSYDFVERFPTLYAMIHSWYLLGFHDEDVSLTEYPDTKSIQTHREFSRGTIVPDATYCHSGSRRRGFFFTGE